MLRYHVFGRTIGVERARDEWQAFYLSSEGKRRAAHDVLIPAFVEEPELAQYLADLCHEWATPEHNEVRRL